MYSFLLKTPENIEIQNFRTKKWSKPTMYENIRVPPPPPPAHSLGAPYGRNIRTQTNKDTVKPVLSGHSKRTPKFGFQYRLSLNAGQKYCRMLQREHSAILSTSIKLPFSIKTLVLSILSGRLRQVLLQ